MAATDAAGGVLALFTDTTDNNEAAVRGNQEVFKYAADAVLYVEAKLQYTELTGSASNVAFGLADAAGANLITDNGAAAAINSSGALIYKLDTATVWRANCKNNSVTVDTASGTTAGGASYQTLGIEILPVDGTNVEITYYVDGQPLREQVSGLQRPIKHRLAYASATEMKLVVYGKTGTTEGLTVNVDYVYGAQRRIN